MFDKYLVWVGRKNMMSKEAKQNLFIKKKKKKASVWHLQLKYRLHYAKVCQTLQVCNWLYFGFGNILILIPISD